MSFARLACLTLAPLAGLVTLAGCSTPGSSSSSTAPSLSAASASPPPPAAAPPKASASASAAAAPSASAPAAGRCPEGRTFIPAGSFRMGSSTDDKRSKDNERPVREVTLSAFCMDRTEVTVAAYAKCAEVGACSRPSKVVVSKGLAPDDITFWSKFCNASVADRTDHPQNCIDWKQAQDHCKWAGGRLPTEAEWEYAARGTDGRAYPWGNEPPGPTRLNGCGSECAANARALGRKDKKTMFEGDDGFQATAPVGKFPEGKSAFGLLDMAGNVWEWTSDGYAPYDPTKLDNPTHDAGPLRVVRGGHWLNANPDSPRTATRESRSEEKRLEDVGFRCVSTPAGG